MLGDNYMHEGLNRQKCPKCKCKDVEIYDHPTVIYPEQWTEYNCKNCGWLVGCIDNSPYVSCYDFEDFVIEI
jgi:hypothetical protein